MSSFKSALKTIFDNRSLLCPNGEPIYSYKLSQNEMQILKQALCNSIQLLSISAYVQANSREWAGAFVLYAAEWWRKEFTGGHWSWEPIFSSLGVAGSGITPANRNNLIASGLRYWKRPILTNGQGRMYLGSVAVEGGLPLTLVTDPNSKLAQYFEQVINDFGKFTLSKPNAYEIAKAHDHCIPASFRTDAVYTVVGQIAEAIYALTDQYSLDEQSEPLRYLDAVAPNWLDKLPLNIEPSVAKGLLDRALGQAIAVQRRLPNTIRLVKRLCKTYRQHAYLVDDPSERSEVWQCKLALTLRQSVHAQYIQQLFAMSALPSRFNLFAMGKKSLLLAKAFTPKNTPDKYLLDVLTHELPDDWFDCDIQLMARTDEGQTWYAPLLGGSALTCDEPWVFIDNDDDWVLTGVGDVTNEASKALVAIAPTSIVQNGDDQSGLQQSHVQFLGNSESPCVRALYLLEQCGIYHIDNAVITLGEETTNNVEYVWHGQELEYQTLPTKCYIGRPSLQILSDGGNASHVPIEKLRWHDLSRQQWLPIETLPLGQSEVALVEEGKVCKRFRLGSLPQDLQIEFKPGRQVNHGQIVISSSRPPMVALADSELEKLDFQVTRHPDSVVIELFSTTEQPPALVGLELWWQEKPKAIALRLPFPTRGVCLLDAEQQLVERNADLLAANLNAYELYGYGLDGEIAVQFSLQAADVRGTFARSAYFSTVLSSIDMLASGMSLSTFRADIQALFALSSSLDTKVQIAVINRGQTVYSCYLSSAAVSLVPNRELMCVELAGAVQSAINLYAIPLGHPDQVPLSLVPQSTDCSSKQAWSFPDDEVEPGAWLVYCDEPKHGIRPLMWSKDLELLPTASDGFELASGMGRRADRLEAFGQVAKELAYDFTRPEWKYVRTLLSFDCVPLTTFDLWRGVTLKPEFMLALLLNANKKEVERVWLMDKQFPLLWYALNIRAGVKVVEAFYQYLLHRLGDDMADVAKKRIETKLTELVSFFPGLVQLVSLMKYKVGINAQKPSLKPAAYLQHVFECRSNLSQQKADLDIKDWPQQFAHQILQSVIAKMNREFVQHCLIEKSPAKDNVMNAPMVLALATIGQADLKVTPEVVHAMREYRRFAPEYFDDCFALTQKMVIGLTKL